MTVREKKKWPDHDGQTTLNLISQMLYASNLCKQLLYLLVNILTSEAELLVEHLVRSRETKALETPNGTVGTY